MQRRFRRTAHVRQRLDDLAALREQDLDVVAAADRLRQRRVFRCRHRLHMRWSARASLLT